MVAYPGVAQLRQQQEQDMRWHEKAECATANPRIFFDPDRFHEAVIVCGPCPVKERCAEERHGADGVWGGKIYKPRPHKRVAS